MVHVFTEDMPFDQNRLVRVSYSHQDNNKMIPRTLTFVDLSQSATYFNVRGPEPDMILSDIPKGTMALSGAINVYM